MALVKLGSRVLLIYIFCSLCSPRIFSPSAAEFACKDGSRSVAVSSRCDGFDDCWDRSDEENCGNETVILYSAISRTGVSSNDEKTSLHGVFLSDGQNLTFYTSGSDRYDKIQSAALSGPRVYFVVHIRQGIPSSVLVQKYRNGSDICNMTFKGYEPPKVIPSIHDINALNSSHIKDIAIDWITTNIYMLISDGVHDSSRIEVCNDEKLCTRLKNKLMENPVNFVLSPKHGKLFWIDQSRQGSFIATSLMDGSFPEKFEQNLWAPKYLTIDQEKNRLYWIDGISVYSRTFSGSDRKEIRKFSKSDCPLSVAVQSNVLYWIKSNETQGALYSCSSDRCSDSTKNLVTLPSAKSVLGLQNTEFYKPQLENPCTDNGCSDICLLATPTNFTCACTADESHLSELSSNGVYCKETTLLATYGNDLYIIGQALSESPKIVKKSFNLQSISAVAYETIQGNVILVEKEQMIYLWNPANNSTILRKLVADEPDSVKSIEFDEFGNNLYWLSSRDYSIKAFSLTTNRTTVIYKGNSTHAPLDFALVTDRRFIFIACLEAHSSVILTRMSMDGNCTYKETVHKHVSDSRLDALLLHYVRDTRLLYLVVQPLELVYFINVNDTFEAECIKSLKSLQHEYPKVQISDSLTSLGSNLFWTDKELDVYWSNISCINSKQIPLHTRISNVDENKKLKIAAVIRTSEQSSPCLWKNNGGCAHLCLGSQYNTSVCACSVNYTLEPSGMCRKYSNNEHRTPDNQEKENSSSLIWIIVGCIAIILIAVGIYVYFVGYNRFQGSIEVHTDEPTFKGEMQTITSCRSEHV